MNAATLDDGVVHLRPWHTGDAQWYAESVTDDLIQAFTTESPTLEAADVRRAIEQFADDPYHVGFVICDARTGERLGNLALNARSGEVSYWLVPAGRGRGIAARAVRIMVAWAQAEGLTSEFVLWSRRDNAASRKVAERVGFVRDSDADKIDATAKGDWDMLAYRLRVTGTT